MIIDEEEYRLIQLYPWNCIDIAISHLGSNQTLYPSFGGRIGRWIKSSAVPNSYSQGEYPSDHDDSDFEFIDNLMMHIPRYRLARRDLRIHDILIEMDNC
jgi:hypothetical protein